MTNLVIVPARVHLVRATESELLTAPVGEAGTAGQYYRYNTSTGKLEKGNATTTGELGNIGGILLDSVSTVNLTGTIALPGAIVDLGDALTSMAYGAPIYISDTDATLADSAGTVSRIMAIVWAAYGATTPDKLARLGIVGA